MSCSKLVEERRPVNDPITTRSFDMRSKASVDLVAEAIKPGSSEPQLTTSGRATCTIRFPLTKSQQNVTGWKRFLITALLPFHYPRPQLGLRPPSEVTGARALTQMPGAHRSSAGDHAFFDAAP